MQDIKYDILDTLIVFPADGTWHKELNLVKWGSREPKYDLRPWNDDRSKMGKGTTLTKEELILLRDKLQEINL